MFSGLESPLDVIEVSPTGSRDHYQINVLVSNDLPVRLDYLDIVFQRWLGLNDKQSRQSLKERMVESGRGSLL